MNKKDNFYFLSYSLPTEPSRTRVYVWRLLKKIGALNIQQSLWILPDIEGMLMELEKIKDTIKNNNGTIYAAYGNFIEGSDEIVKKFNDERDREYEELLEYCSKFHEEMRYETEIKNFTFAELEENEEELDKLEGWYEKIKKRDYFSSPSGKKADEEIANCKAEFEEFSNCVYKTNS